MQEARFTSTAMVVVLFSTACVNSGGPNSTSSSSTASSSPSTSTIPTTNTTTSPTTPDTTASTTTTHRPATLGLITTTGVPVAVVDEERDGYLVLSPCGFETLIENGSPLGPTSVVLDPGHGGPTDTGAVGSNGLAEKEVNLRVAQETLRVLAGRGIDAVLTRTADYTSPLFVRANLADTLEAHLMISIHHNAPTPGPSESPGTEIFIQKDSVESSRLGGLLWEHTRAGLSVFDISWSAAPDAGVMTVLNSRGDDAYGIIRHPETTTALVELGYISNPPEAELFAETEYVKVAAMSLANAVEDYLVTDDMGSGFVEGRVFNPRPGVSQDVCTDPDLG